MTDHPLTIRTTDDTPTARLYRDPDDPQRVVLEVHTAERVDRQVIHAGDLLTALAPDTAQDGAALIATERRRHVEEEGYTPAHDAEHDPRALIDAGRSYLTHPDGRSLVFAPDSWPWSRDAWKPTPDDRVRELVKAGSLIAAAIDAIKAQGVSRG